MKQLFQIFKLNKILSNVINDKTDLPVEIGYKIFILKKKLSEIEEYVFSVINLTDDESRNNDLWKSVLLENFTVPLPYIDALRFIDFNNFPSLSEEDKNFILEVLNDEKPSNS